MADPSRYRQAFNGPEQSAIYQEKWTRGCYICTENKTMKNMPSVHFSQKAHKNFPHTGKDDCQDWKKKERK